MKPRALHNSFFVIPAHTLKGTKAGIQKVIEKTGFPPSYPEGHKRE
jgi:hypothetical protein